jgi:hypothetical protein
MTPPQDPTPDPAEKGSSKVSSAADDGGLFADAGGPEFDAKAPAPEPDTLEEPRPLDLWDETKVKTMLTTQGEVVHAVIAADKGSEEWRYTEGDLRTIAPPLTNILNRYDATRAMAATSDELMVAIGFGHYAIRSYGQRRAALAAIAQGAGDGTVNAYPAEPAAAPAGGVDETEPADPEAETIPPLRGSRR